MPSRIIIRDNSFTNLFPEITYNKDELTLPILDIWNNLRLVTFPEASEAAYVYYRLQEGDNLYDTINWWWLIPLVNYAEDPFTFIDDVLNGDHPIDIPAKNIRILRRSFLPLITRNITVIKNIQQPINERDRLEGKE